MPRLRFMKPSFSRVLVAGLILMIAGGSRSWADEPPTLDGIHQTLQQAAGDSVDSAPPAAQQKELVEKALNMLREYPLGHPRRKKQAVAAVEEALADLENGDPNHQARTKILEADDDVRSFSN
jgi:hypothetical protein